MGSAASTYQQSGSVGLRVYVIEPVPPCAEQGDGRRDSVCTLEPLGCAVRARQLMSNRLPMRNTSKYHVILILCADRDRLVTKEAFVLALQGVSSPSFRLTLRVGPQAKAGSNRVGLRAGNGGLNQRAREY